MSLAAPSLPEAFVKLVSPLLVDGLDDFLQSFAQSAWQALRRSNRRPPVQMPLLTRQVPWAHDAWYLPEGIRPGAHPLHWAGAYYLQEPSAMAAAAALNPLPGEKVLDLCAAPGGKASQMGDMMGGRGLLMVNDPVSQRAVELSRTIERMGIRNALVTADQPERLAAALPLFFDKILVDAPCSGEGMFRKDPEALSRWTPDLPALCAKRQSGILDQAALMLKPGGRLVYSTCTFNALENEGVVDAFLLCHPDFRAVPFSLPGLGKAERGRLRIWPHLARGEGHFIALLEKSGEGSGKNPPPKREGQPLMNAAGRELCRAVSQALPDWTSVTLEADAVFAGTAVSLPPACPPLDGLKVLRLGLHLGGLAGKTARPDHALALAAQPRRCLALDEEGADAFRRGLELPAPPDCSGWAAPCLDGWPLGWGKASAGRCKNHYPKGLRKFAGKALYEE